MEYIEGRILGDVDTARDLLLVHAICLKPDGQPYAHAWVEDGDLCWGAGLLDGVAIYYSAERAEFYAHFRPQDITRYTLEDVYEHNQASRHYGPWKPEYLALCAPKEPCPTNDPLSAPDSLPTS